MDTVATAEWVTVQETSVRLGLSPARIRQFLKAGRLEYIWTPLGRLISAESVEQMRRAREATS